MVLTNDTKGYEMVKQLDSNKAYYATVNHGNTMVLLTSGKLVPENIDKSAGKFAELIGLHGATKVSYQAIRREINRRELEVSAEADRKRNEQLKLQADRELTLKELRSSVSTINFDRPLSQPDRSDYWIEGEERWDRTFNDAAYVEAYDAYTASNKAYNEAVRDFFDTVASKQQFAAIDVLDWKRAFLRQNVLFSMSDDGSIVVPDRIEWVDERPMVKAIVLSEAFEVINIVLIEPTVQLTAIRFIMAFKFDEISLYDSFGRDGSVRIEMRGDRGSVSVYCKKNVERDYETRMQTVTAVAEIGTSSSVWSIEEAFVIQQMLNVAMDIATSWEDTAVIESKF